MNRAYLITLDDHNAVGWQGPCPLLAVQDIRDFLFVARGRFYQAIGVKVLGNTMAQEQALDQQHADAMEMVEHGVA